MQLLSYVLTITDDALRGFRILGWSSINGIPYILEQTEH